MHKSKLHVAGGTAEIQIVTILYQVVLRQKWKFRHLLADQVAEYHHVTVPAELRSTVQNALDINWSCK